MPAHHLAPYHPFVSAEARERFRSEYQALESECPVEWETTSVETDRGSVFVRSIGRPDAQPIVLLPGAGGHSLFWPADLIRMLSLAHRVHAVDALDDIGRSVSSIANVKTADHLRMLDRLLDRLAPGEPVVMVGGSRGGWMSAEYALHAPERLAATVWLSPALVASGWSLGALRFVGLSLPMMRNPTEHNVDVMLRWILPRLAAEQPAYFDRMVRHTAVCYQCFDTRRVGRGFGPRRLTDAELESIRVPALYLAGVEERLGSAEAAVSRLRRVAPRVQADTLGGTGHDMLWVRTNEVARRMTEFLATV